MKNLKKLPTCKHYGEFLAQAVQKINISINEARAKYGQFTYKQWYNLLNS